MSPKATYLLAALLATPSAALSADSLLDNREIEGRSIFAIEASLAERGIKATGIEEWGSVIRVEAYDEEGRRRLLFIDKQTLRPLASSR